jgi:ubiquitin-conjugating enzyme E2 G1
MSTNSTMTPLASNTLLLRRQLAELTKHPVEGFSAGAYPIILSRPFQRSRPDSHLREGLVDENNLYEWDVMIIGFALSSLPLSPLSPSSSINYSYSPLVLVNR